MRVNIRDRTEGQNLHREIIFIDYKTKTCLWKDYAMSVH